MTTYTVYSRYGTDIFRGNSLKIVARLAADYDGSIIIDNTSGVQVLYDGPRISKTAAKAQAHRESHMYRQGSGYIVSTWDDGCGCNITSEVLPYHVARRAVAEYRRNRVAQLLLLGLEVA